tara:strand:+ start:3751 stop:4635 length:885 start_codon:yes stop_codon:yes gene_type:complete
MRLQLYHLTEFHYSAPVTDSVKELRLTPPTTRYQTCESSLITLPEVFKLSPYDDLNINRVHHFEIPEPHDKLSIECTATVSTRNKIDFEDLPFGFHHGHLRKCHDREECYPYIQDSAYIQRTPEIWRQALDVQGFSDDVFQTSYCIMEHIHENYQYQSGIPDLISQAVEVIESQSGFSQDFSHAMTALCRSIDIPARYVNGYLHDPTRYQNLRGSKTTHTWVEVYIEGSGWIGLDPANNKVVDETYIILARGRDYRDVAPVTGAYSGTAQSTVQVVVKVDRLPEIPAASASTSP